MTYDFYRPQGRSVWTGKELSRSDEWIVHFPARALDEMDANVKRLRERNVPVETITRDDFPLSSIADMLTSSRQEIALGRGFVVMRGLDPTRYTLPELSILYWGIGTHFGTAKAQSFLGDMIGDIRDVSDEEPDPRKRRGYHSGGMQPVHTDSCDIVSMLSIRTAKEGGASVLSSAHTVHNIMMDNCPGLLQAFYDGFFMRGTDTDAAATGRSPLTTARVPAYAHTDGWLNCSFVRGYVERAVRAGDVRLSPVEQAAVETFTVISNHPDIAIAMVLKPGDMQFVNNRTMLHGRAHFEDYPEMPLRRHLLRLWLTDEAWPRLAASQDNHSDAIKKIWAENAMKRMAVNA